MEHVDGSCVELSSPPQAAAINTSGAWSSETGVPWSSQMVLETLMLLMCVGAVTGNTLVIVVVVATKTFHSVTSVLIVNLAVSDLLVGCGVMPFVAVSVLNSEWMNCTVLCVYVGYTSSVYCTASVLTLAAIALDRYHSIMKCLRSSSHWRTCVLVVWIWLQALVSSFPPLLGWSSISYIAPMHSCAVNWAASPSYTTLMAALSYFTPAVVMVFCYVSIVKVAQSHARRIHILHRSVHHSRIPSSGFTGRSSHQYCGNLCTTSGLIHHISAGLESFVGSEENTSQGPQQSFLRQNRGTLRVFMIIAAFFLCWTPYTGVALVQAAESTFSGRSTLVPSSVVTFSYWLLLLGSDINPLLYALLSRRFQNALQGLRHRTRTRTRVGDVGSTGRDNNMPRIRSAQLYNSDNLASQSSKYCSTIFTISTDYKTSVT
ncbi:G-protein coupled receptor 161 [Gouania willdenowi]|uniref:G-protein coupled receptor 161 n=1 Tax=Gouania willdenowi TaxID=441366 RepID=UPI0010556B5F|nr:G-protein coupled receptor 161-like [Gouania willdenowi]